MLFERIKIMSKYNNFSEQLELCQLEIRINKN